MATPEWLEALIEYLNIRRKASDLQAQCDGWCLGLPSFYTCSACKDRRNFEYRMEALIRNWADAWAVQLYSIRENVVGLLDREAESA